MLIKNVSKPTHEFATSKTVVWWDLDTCPLPNGYDPSRVVPRIDTELRTLGYTGPLTIVALGNLKGIPFDFLRMLSAAGVVIKHIPNGTFCVMRNIYECEALKESRVNIMVISSAIVVLCVTRHLLERGGGYNLLLAYPPTCCLEFPHPPSLVLCAEWHWIRESLLKDSGSDLQLRTLEKGSEKFSCRSCFFECPSLEDLIKHLQRSKHLLKIAMESRNRECKFNVIARQEAEAREIATNKEREKAGTILVTKVVKRRKKKARKNPEEQSEAIKLKKGEYQKKSIHKKRKRQSIVEFLASRVSQM